MDHMNKQDVGWLPGFWMDENVKLRRGGEGKLCGSFLNVNIKSFMLSSSSSNNNSLFWVFVLVEITL